MIRAILFPVWLVLVAFALVIWLPVSIIIFFPVMAWLMYSGRGSDPFAHPDWMWSWWLVDQVNKLFRINP